MIYGAQKFAIRVQADPEAAAARGLSLDDIRTAVVARQFLDAGRHAERAEAGRRAAGLRPDGQGGRLPPDRGVAWRNGSPVKLDEVARIYDSVENDKIASWFNGDRSIVLAIQKQPDANTVAVVDGVLAKLPALRAQIPPSVTIQVADGPFDVDPAGRRRRRGDAADRHRRW